jgi:Clostripain family
MSCKRAFFRSLLVAFLFTPAAIGAKPWTVMVLMSAHNDLECLAPLDFAALANIGSSGSIDVFAEVARRDIPVCGPKKGGVRRFKVWRGMSLKDTSSPVTGPDADMARGSSVVSFIRWTRAHYQSPDSRRYALVILSHGVGTKLQTSIVLTAPLGDIRAAMRSDVGVDGGSAGAQQYMYVQDLANKLTESRIRLDLILLDSCQMGTIENAYAFRKIADTLIASESAISPYAWDYTSMLRDSFTRSDPRTELVNNFWQSNKDFDFLSTASSLDLSRVDSVADRVSDLGEHFWKEMNQANRADGEKFTADLARIRAALTPFGGIDDDRSTAATVDIGAIAQAVMATHLGNATTQDLAKRLLSSLAASFVLANSSPHTSGLSVFFPGDYAQLHAVNNGEQSYDPVDNRNCQSPSATGFAFVACKPGWAEFIKDFISRISSKNNSSSSIPR